MTAVGKVLVFVVLVFALVDGGMVMVVFMTRANWEDAYKDAVEKFEVVKRDRDQTASENLKLRTEATDLRKGLKDAIATVAKDEKEAKEFEKVIQDLEKRDEAKVVEGLTSLIRRSAELRKQAEKDRDTVKEELATIQTSGVKGNADATAAQAVSQARKLQVENLEKTLASERKDKQKLIETATFERQERIRAQVATRTLERANEQLEDTVRDLAKELARSKAGLGTATTVSRKRGEENPPDVEVEGRILKVAPQGDLIHVSVGSDAGLKPGHTLKVFRLTGGGQYLGVIELVTVRPHESVGRPLKRTAFEWRPNDRVGSRISSGGG